MSNYVAYRYVTMEHVDAEIFHFFREKNEISHGESCFSSFHPDLSDLTFDLLNFFLVSSSCVVWYHRFQFCNFLCIC